MVVKPISSNAAQLGRGTLVLLAAACAITVGNVILCQPLLDQIAVSMGVPPRIAGFVAVSAQIGYALGILFVLPLADKVAPRKLVFILLVLTTLLLLGAALSPTVFILIALSFLLTCTTVIPQILIPIISGHVSAERRVAILGALQTGIILGILLSRTVFGAVAQIAHTWRASYVLAAILTGILVGIVPRQLPQRKFGTAPKGYFRLLQSLLPLLRHQPLRLSMALGFLVFGAFSVLWSTLAFHLSSPPFDLGPAAVGLFGLYSAPGAIIAPRVAMLSRRIGAFKINLLSVVAVGIAFLLGGWVETFSFLPLVVAINLLDFGVQAGQISNQKRIFTLGDDIRARVNTLYMAASFGGGAVGALAGTLAWSLAGWHGVCALGFILAVVAGVVIALHRNMSRI